LTLAHILFAYKQFPAPSVSHAGGESLFKLMAEWRRRGHRLTLVARILDEERAQLPAVEALCDAIYTVPHHRSLPGPRPLAMLRSYVAFRRMAARALRETSPDFLHVETTQTAAVLAGLRLPPASFRTQDVNWFLHEQSAAHARGWARWLAQGKAAFFHRFEPWLWRRYAVMLAISEGDRCLLAPYCAQRPLLMLPLTPAVFPVPPEATSPPASPIAPGPNLLFVGAMSRDHNLAGVGWFLDEVWPRIRAEVPAARFFIVGGNPPETLRARADGQSVVVTGFVDDLAPWYRAAAVFVSPLLVAGGLLQKVVDAMAMGTPVVATSVCNHGLGATPGVHLLTTDAPEDLAAAVIRLLRDPHARSQIAAAGQVFIQPYCDIAAAVDAWEQALLRVSNKASER